MSGPVNVSAPSARTMSIRRFVPAYQPPAGAFDGAIVTGTGTGSCNTSDIIDHLILLRAAVAGQHAAMQASCVPPAPDSASAFVQQPRKDRTARWRVGATPHQTAASSPADPGDSGSPDSKQRDRAAASGSR